MILCLTSLTLMLSPTLCCYRKLVILRTCLQVEREEAVITPWSPRGGHTMSNPFVRVIVNLVVMGASVFGRAFVAAYHQAIQNAKAGGVQAAKSATRGGMAVDEALKVLELQKAELSNSARIQQQFEKYFAQNDPTKGGSFYLQSKVYRAKEALERDIEAARAKAEEAKAEAERARRT